MEIILSVNVPDADLGTAVANSCGEGGDFAEWLADFFERNDSDYLKTVGLEKMTIEVVEIN